MFDTLKKLFSKPPPAPPPDVSALTPPTDQQLVEEFFSQDKTRQVLILRDDHGNFRIRSFRWDVEDWAVAGGAFWIPDDAMNTITDTLEDAHRLAGEASKPRSD